MARALAFLARAIEKLAGQAMKPRYSIVAPTEPLPIKRRKRRKAKRRPVWAEPPDTERPEPS